MTSVNGRVAISLRPRLNCQRRVLARFMILVRSQIGRKNCSRLVLKISLEISRRYLSDCESWLTTQGKEFVAANP